MTSPYRRVDYERIVREAREAEERTAREVEKLRHEHPAWSVISGRRVPDGRETYKFQATPKQHPDSFPLLADTADELAQRIAEAESGPIGTRAPGSRVAAGELTRG